MITILNPQFNQIIYYSKFFLFIYKFFFASQWEGTHIRYENDTIKNQK